VKQVICGSRSFSGVRYPFCHPTNGVKPLELLRGSRQLVTDLLRGNWCNGFWP